MNLVSLLYRTFNVLGPLRAIAHIIRFRSFYLEPVYRLIPIFNPFLMTILLVSIVVVEAYPFIGSTMNFSFSRFCLPLSSSRLPSPP